MKLATVLSRSVKITTRKFSVDSSVSWVPFWLCKFLLKSQCYCERPNFVCDLDLLVVFSGLSLFCPFMFIILHEILSLSPVYLMFCVPLISTRKFCCLDLEIFFYDLIENIFLPFLIGNSSLSYKSIVNRFNLSMYPPYSTHTFLKKYWISTEHFIRFIKFLISKFISVWVFLQYFNLFLSFIFVFWIVLISLNC